MTQPLAYWLGGTLLGLLAFDLMLFGTGHALFLAQHGLALVHWLAFWR